MDIFMDMMSDQETPFCEIVEKNKPNSYYQGLGIHLLKQMDTNEHYFHFLQAILSNYNQLEEEQKKRIENLFEITCGGNLIDVNFYEEILPNGKKYISVYRKEGSMLNSDEYVLLK